MNETEITARSIELLEDIKKSIKKRNPITDINLFSILGMETKEVSAHSAFLFCIFKPFNYEGKTDDKNLRVLYEFLRSKKNDLPENPKHIDIFREKPFEDGRMDFLIEYDSDAIVIELKIFAGEQEDQIMRYRKFLKDNNYTEDNVFFLTPTGWESTTGNSIPISLTELCECVFKSIAEERKGDYQVVLNQYISLIKKIGETNHMDTIKEKNDIIAINELNNAKEEIVKGLKNNFTKQFKATLNALIDNFNVKLMEESVPENKFELLYRICDEDKLKNLYKDTQGSLVSKDIDFFFRVRINESTYPFFSGIVIRGKDKDFVPHGIKGNKTNSGIIIFESIYWLSYEYATWNGNKINFSDYSFSSESVLNIIDDEFIFSKDAISGIAQDTVRSFNDQYSLLMESLKPKETLK